MPFVKVVRSNEEDAKGVKPIIVTFEKQTVRDPRDGVISMLMFLGSKCCPAEIQVTERKQHRYQRGFPERYYAEKTSFD